jgi:hypothetical protein
MPNFKTFKFCFFIFALLCLGVTTSSRAENSESEKATRSLDFHFSEIDRSEKLNRRIFGWTSVGLSAGLTVSALASLGSDDETVRDYFPWILGIPGVLFGGLGAYFLTVQTEVENSLSQYFSMPNKTTDELTKKKEWGEALFSRLSEESRSMRYQTSIINTAAGSGLLLWFFFKDSDSSEKSDLLFLGIFGVATGATGFFFPTKIEKEYITYQQSKVRQSTLHKSSNLFQDINFTLTPVPKGFLAGFKAQF